MRALLLALLAVLATMARAADLLVYDGGNMAESSPYFHGAYAPIQGGLWAAGAGSTIINVGSQTYTHATASNPLPPVAPQYLYSGRGAGTTIPSMWAAGATDIVRNTGLVWNLFATSGTVRVNNANTTLYPAAATTSALNASTNSLCTGYLKEGIYNGAVVLQTITDQWHGGQLRTYGCNNVTTTVRYGILYQAQTRRDFSKQNVLQFSIRTDCAYTAVVYPAVSMSTWNAASNTVGIRSYTPVIDGTWRTVKIPLNHLRTSAWSLTGVESVNFGNNSFPASTSSCQYMLKDINVLDDGSLPSDDPASLANVQQLATANILSLHPSFTSGAYAPDRTILAVGAAGLIMRFNSQTNAWVSESSGTNVNLRGVVILGTSASNAVEYVVGDSGLILAHPVGAAWTSAAVVSPTTTQLNAIHGVSGVGLYAVGNNGVAVFNNGGAWTTSGPTGTSAHLLSVSVHATGVVYACGSGVVLQRLASGWRTLLALPAVTFSGISAYGPNGPQAMAVGSAGTIYSFANATPAVMASGTTASLLAVDMTVGGGGIAVGAGGTILSLGWTGAWAAQTNIRTGTLSAVKQSNGPCLFYADEAKESDGTWSLQLKGDAWHAPAVQLYCGGGGRRNLCQYDTLEFYVRGASSASTTGLTVRFTSFSGSSVEVNVTNYLPNNVIPTTFAKVSIPLADLALPKWRLTDVEQLIFGGSSTSSTYFISEIAVITKSSPSSLCAAATQQLYGIQPAAQTLAPSAAIRDITVTVTGQCTAMRPMLNVFCPYDQENLAVGDGGAIWQLNSSTLVWAAQASGTAATLYAAVSFGLTDAWALGAGGVVVHRSASGWAVHASSSAAAGGKTLFGAVGLYDSNAQVGWAVGEAGTILKLANGAWSAVQTGLAVSQTLLGVSAIPSDAYNGLPLVVVAVGAAGTVLQYTSFTQAWALSQPVQSTLRAVLVGSVNAFWAVGDNGVAIRGDGATWTRLDTGTTATLNAIDGTAGGVAVAGASGTILQYGWQGAFLSTAAPTVQDLFAVRGQGSCLFYATEVVGQGVGGVGSAVLLSPDNWHNSAIKLYCGHMGRRDWSQYDALSFSIRAVGTKIGSPSVSLTTWDRSSPALPIASYIAGGAVTDAYRRVQIPLSALRVVSSNPSVAWDLGNVETIVLSGASAGCDFAYVGSADNCEHYLIDDIRVMDLTPPHVTALAVESASVVRLTLNEPYDMTAIRNTSLFTLMHGFGHEIDIAEVGLSVRFTRFGDGSGAPVNEYAFYLRFAQDMVDGGQYTLIVGGLVDESGNAMATATFPITFDSMQQNHNVKVNQIGYTAGRPKVGYVGGFAGDLGGRVFAAGAGVFAVSKGFGKDWTTAAAAQGSINAMAALSESVVYAVGNNGAIFQQTTEGAGFVAAPQSGAFAADLLAISFSSAGVGWIVGSNGFSARLDVGASTWVAVPTAVTATLRGVWSGPHSVNDLSDVSAWAVGDNGLTLKFVNGAWVAQTAPTTATLYAIAEGSGQSAWAVGGAGTIMYLQYGSWNLATVDASAASEVFVSVAADRTGSAVVVGAASGAIYKQGSAGFTAVSSLPTRVAGFARVSQRYCGYAGSYGKCIRWTAIAGSAVYVASDSLQFELDYTASGPLTAAASVPYGPLRISATQAHIYALDASGQPAAAAAATAPLSVRALNYYLSGEDLYSFDFSALDAAGSYIAVVPGVGASVPFTIGQHALDFAAYTAGRGLYYQRCGASEIVEPYADPRFVRPACHNGGPSAAHPEALVDANTVSLAEQYGLHVETGYKNVTGGLHDAGDFGKYVTTVTQLSYYLLAGYDIDPTKFPDGALNIPQSGNGIPDVLDILKWEADFMISLQDSVDGAIYVKVTTRDWYQGMPDADGDRFIFTKSTYDTATFAATLASLGRAIAPFDPAYSQLCLQRAQLAWAFLQAHPSPIPVGGFVNPSGVVTGEPNDQFDIDNRLWAAAELFRATNSSAYEQYILANWQTFLAPPSSNSGAGAAVADQMHWAYAKSAGDPSHVAVSRSRFVNAASYVRPNTLKNPYKNGARLDVADWIGWGTFTYGTMPALALLQANHFSPSAANVDAAYLNVDTQLGANPLSMSFITGLGARSPMRPTCVVCMYDGVVDPYPGIPVFGVFAHLSNGHPFYVYVQHDANNYPSIWQSLDTGPILRRYVDDPQVIPESEFTIGSMASTYAALALLAGPPQVLFPQGTASLSGNSITIPLQARSTAAVRTVPCSDIFAPSSLGLLGAATCELAGTRVVVTLGAGAAIQAGTALHLAPFVAYSDANTVRVGGTVVVQ
eukprot:m.55830 g.55830  ORF g.55830 m.55830 type:complete len:2286 (-) comp6720_c0_seq1:67-6924(-)